MNANSQNPLQNLYLQQLMSLGLAGGQQDIKSELSPDSQHSTTPNAGTENANPGRQTVLTPNDFYSKLFF
jgi:hypothetical protein